MKHRLLVIWTLSLICGCLMAATVQPNVSLTTYYANANGKTGRTLELALKAIVYPHTKLSYNNLWTAYETTDPGPADSIPAGSSKTDLVYDMYAWMGQFPKYYSDNDHTQTSGINREHCVPNSWWGGESGNAIAYTDLHHLVPSDGAANNAKSNWALGEYKTGMTLVWPTSTKTNSGGEVYMTADTHTHTEGGHCYANASHVWKPSDASQYGGSTQLFEPADEYKGDFARMYLYVVCAYEQEITWQVNYMFTSDASKLTTINSWAKALLLKWHRQDPVSEKELIRNNSVYTLQQNRNPFIDYPEWVEYIWGDKTSETAYLSSLTSAYTATTCTPPALSATNRSVKVGSTVNGAATTLSSGALTYSSSNTAVATVSQTGVITGVAAGTATITVEQAAAGTYCESSTSFTVTVTDATKYTVRYYVNGSPLFTQSATAGTALSAPDPEACDGYTFMGWTTQQCAATNTTQPTYTNAVPVGGATLYALFSRTEGGGAAQLIDSYQKITSTTDLTSGNYLVVGNNTTAGTCHAMKNTTGSRAYYIAQTAVTPEDDVITTTDESLIWQITVSGGQLTLYNAAISQYLYILQSGAYYNMGFTSTATDAAFSYSYSGGEWLLYSVAYPTYLLEYYMTGAYFAAYKSKNGPIHLYKQMTATVSTIYFTTAPDCTCIYVVTVVPDDTSHGSTAATAE